MILAIALACSSPEAETPATPPPTTSSTTPSVPTTTPTPTSVTDTATTPPTPTPTTTTTGSDTAKEPQWVLVSAYTSGEVLALDPDDGSLQQRWGGVPGAQALRVGPDGALWAVAEEVGQVLRFDGDGFVPVVEEGLSAPTGLGFAPDGDLLVADFATDQVLRFSPDGAPDGVVLNLVDGPDAGLLLDDQGLLWVPCFDGDVLLTSPLEEGGRDVYEELDSPRALLLVDDEVWFTSWRGDAVRRGPREGPSEVFASVPRPSGLARVGDELWVATDQEPLIRRLDATTGAEVGVVDLSATGAVGLTYLATAPVATLQAVR